MTVLNFAEKMMIFGRFCGFSTVQNGLKMGRCSANNAHYSCIHLKQNNTRICSQRRSYTTTENFADDFYTNPAGLMSAWQIYRYGESDEFVMTTSAHIPIIRKPTDVLVKVHAASVNPLDVNMRGGYGRNVINAMREINACQLSVSEFPLTLGRDFSGTVINTGMGVTQFKPGDEVWGALAVHRQGSHAQYAVAQQCEISHKPTDLTHTEAASVPYIALTAWAAICTFGRQSQFERKSQVLQTNLTHIEAASVPYTALTAWAAICTFGQQSQFQRKRYLVTAGAGGVGTFAIQLLKAWGGHVTTTCSSSAVSLCAELGADDIIDYTEGSCVESLRHCDKFDMIVDPVGSIPPSIASSLLHPSVCSKHISLTSPVLRNTDQLGMVLGLAKSSLQLGVDFLQSLSGGSLYGWAYFIPNGDALKTIAQLYDTKQIRPVIDATFPFHDLPAAYEKVGQGHARGKTVIEMDTGQ